MNSKQGSEARRGRPSGCCRSGLGQAERLDRCEHGHAADRRTEASQAAMSKVVDATGKEGEMTPLREEQTDI